MKLFRMQFYTDDYRYDWVIQFQMQNDEYIKGLTIKGAQEGAQFNFGRNAPVQPSYDKKITINTIQTTKQGGKVQNIE